MGIDLTRALVLSRDARVRWDADGRPVAEARGRADALEIDASALDVLAAFAAPADPEAVLETRLRSEADPRRRERVRSEFSTLVDRLRRIGVLVRADRGNAAGATVFTDPLRQLTLLWDALRMNAYRRALERSARGKVLVEIGCGHGVLACLAVRAGASRVYAIEETSVIDLAREIARVNGVDDRIVFLEGNSLDVELPEQADLVYADLMGPDPLGAGMLVYMRDAVVRFLRPRGEVIPSRLTLLAVGVESARIAAEVGMAHRWLHDAEALTDAYGLDLSPLVDISRRELERAYESFSYKQFLEPAGDATTGADRVLTREVQVAEFPLDTADPARVVDARLLLPVEQEGTLNAMATSAVVRVDDETLLTTSPFASERPLAWGGQFISTLPPSDVVAGTTAAVDARVTPWTSPAVSYTRPAGSMPARAEPLFPA